MTVTLVEGPIPAEAGRAWELTFGDTRRPGWFLTLVMAAVGGRFCCAERFHGGPDDLSAKWQARFPVARCVREPRLACEQVQIEGEDLDAGALPFGLPNRANRLRWYPALLATVDR